MSNREAIEGILKEAYAARLRGDVDGIVELFSNDLRFQLAGSPNHSPAAAAVSGREEFRGLLSTMVKTFELLDHKIVTMMIDGDGATVQWRGTFRSGVTGETAETDIVDVVKVKDGRISSFIEFCDTALASRLMGQ